MFWGDDPFVQAIALRRKSGSRPDPQRRVKSKHTRRKYDLQKVNIIPYCH